jgi:hypothetical protein
MKVPEDIIYKLPTGYKNVTDIGLRQLLKQLILAITDMYRDVSRAINFNEDFLRGQEKSADPSDPDEGNFILWMSDGTGSGDDGDIMIKITAGGSTKTGTVVDFSGL